MKVDILAVGVHPDDVELCCAGTLLRHIDMGYKVAIVDLTRGELGTRGSAETRDKEAAEAARIIGIEHRENLHMADGFFRKDEAHQHKLIEAIRKYRPDIILANAIHDRHPDHSRAAELVREAAFLSGLPKIETKLEGQPQEAWRPKALYHYIQGYYIKPDIVVDISAYEEKKMEAVRAYSSQFYDPDAEGEKETFISQKGFFDLIRGRAVEMGAHIGARYAEGFTVNRMIGVDDLLALR